MFNLTTHPHRNLAVLPGDLNNLFAGFFPAAPADANGTAVLAPPLDIIETEAGYEVRADLPGVKKEELSVQIKQHTLIIEAETRNRSAQKDDAVIKSERYTGQYRRALRLGKTVDESKVRADYQDGVLTITLPRATEPEGKKVDIQIH